MDKRQMLDFAIEHLETPPTGGERMWDNVNNQERFVEVYYSPRRNRFLLLYIYGNRIIAIHQPMGDYDKSLQFTRKLESEINTSICLGEL
jgi:hypothetical protein